MLLQTSQQSFDSKGWNVPKKVSVLMVTYNHEKFIEKALDSVLMQRVNFSYDIVIGDDCSQDDTRNILIDYQKKHPNKIRMLLNEKNHGWRGKFNFIQTFCACQGEYVAILEGDDYWTSPSKLQKQVDFLDMHRDYSLCFHAFKYIFEDGSDNKPAPIFPPEIKPYYTISDLLGKRNFIHVGSVMFRRGIFGELPEWYYSSIPGDVELYILCGEHGRIGYINEVNSVYRVHGDGVWSSKDLIQRLQIQIEMYRNMNAYLNFRFDKVIRSSISFFYYQIANEYIHNDCRSKALINLFKCIVTSPSDQPVPLRRSLLRMAAWATPDPVRRPIRLLLRLNRNGEKV